MSGINLEQFEEQVKDVQSAYNKKYNELAALRAQFEDLVDQIELTNKSPDELEEDLPVSKYDELMDAHEDEKRDISDVIANLAYDFDLEWDGSFEEGSNSFWTPSSC